MAVLRAVVRVVRQKAGLKGRQFFLKAVLVFGVAALSLGAAQARSTEQAQKAQAKKTRAVGSRKDASAAAADAAVVRGLSGKQIETRLLDIYQAITEARNREALDLAQKLTQEQPNFQLGQMLYADLLLAQTRPVAVPGSAPEALTRAAPGAITDLRAEAKVRIKALQERPPAGTIPENFTGLTAWSPQAIAVDISKSRLYLFARNAAGQLQLEHDYYISIARLGAIKTNEGDLRTPLGPYFITSHLYPAQLSSFYGAGALPLNYPNAYDTRRGKTGRGIWLHGTPPGQYSRPPLASEGCVVLTNPDFTTVASIAHIRSTPVVIAPSLNWVNKPGAWEAGFDQAWKAWRATKIRGDLQALAPYYFANYSGQDNEKWPQFYQDLVREARQGVQLPEHMREVSRVYWRESPTEELVLTTFAQTVGNKTKTRRQYWLRQGQAPWRIFFESDV